jgi:putative FmdB family regulatory protein
VPTYAYACTSCGHEFDVVQSITAPPLQTCEACGGSLRKVFHPVGVAFKGSGFYRTDSRAGSGAASSKNTDGKGTTGDGGAGSTAAGGSSSSTSGESAGSSSSSSSSATSSTGGSGGSGSGTTKTPA